MASDKPKVEISIEASQKTGAITATATELDKLQGKMTEAKGEAEKMGESMGGVEESTLSLGTAIASFVSVAAIAAFFKEAVAESLKEEEALRVLRGSLESTGNSWEKYGKIVEDFAAIQQAQTRFDDTVTFEVLGKLARATKTVEEAMRATVLAQNLSVATGKSLGETTEIVNGLLLGQSRAIMQANKEFGSYAGGATTAQQALDNLARSVKGVAAAEESGTKSFAQFKAAVGDSMQAIGDVAVPVLADMSRALGGLLRSTMEYIGAIDKLKVPLVDQVELLRQAVDHQIIFGGRTAAGIAKLDGLRRAYEEKNKELERSIELEAKAAKPVKGGLTAQQSIQDAEQAAQRKIEIETQLSDSIKQVTLDEFDYKKGKIFEAAEAAVTAGADSALIVESTNASLDANNAARNAKKTKEEDALAKADKARNAAKFADFASTMGFISTLSTSKNKELALIGKAAAIALAYMNTSVAVTRALASAPPPFNFALAALVGAAGAAQIATIAGVQLEHGGVVPGSAGGTAATIGEKGRAEAVLPLESPRAMEMVGKAIADAGGSGGGGATVINITVTAMVPEWRAIMEAIAEEAERGSPEIIRVASRLSDLAQLNSGRSS